MIRRVYPSKTIIRNCYVERVGNPSVARPLGSYPITVFLEGSSLKQWEKVDCLVIGAKARSLVGVPLPINPRELSLGTMKKIFGNKLAVSIKAGKLEEAEKDPFYKYVLRKREQF
ncbi:hypothetical protein [Thermofilum adornatum]|nr:hypothetical protein [Thermofilum adornatum]